jgi:hypothetical protein
VFRFKVTAFDCRRGQLHLLVFGTESSVFRLVDVALEGQFKIN